jgi:hypothetical protein
MQRPTLRSLHETCIKTSPTNFYVLHYRVMFTAALHDICQLVVVEEVASVVRRIVVETNTRGLRRCV